MDHKLTAADTKDAEGKDINEVSGIVVDAAIKVHTVLGAGLLEHPYQVCLKCEIAKRGLKVLSEVTLPVVYEKITIDIGYRLDLLVEDELIVELKSVAQLTPLHKAQLLTYMKLAKKRLGLLINFNTPHLKEGIIRLIDSSSASCHGSCQHIVNAPLGSFRNSTFLN